MTEHIPDELSPAGRDLRAHPDELRPDHLVVRNDRGEWVLLRHDLVRHAALDDIKFSSAVSRFSQVPNGLDGPEHTAFRTALHPFLTPAALAPYQADFERIGTELVASLPRGASGSPSTPRCKTVWSKRAADLTSPHLGGKTMFDDEARQFNALNERQCRDLLQRTNLARVAWQSADGPQILPITYACHGDFLVFRTSPYGPLSDLMQPTDIAFEADELDQQRRSGWSVVVKGRAAAVAEPSEMVKLWTVDGLAPWAPGIRNVFIQITPQRITGRRLRHDPDPSPATD